MRFDFDYWADLARRDPRRFEQERDMMLHAAIRSSEKVERLSALQWRIDQERLRGKTALGGCLRVHNMMWTVFSEFNDVLSGLRTGQEDGNLQPVCHEASPAMVLPFRPRKCNET